MKKLIILVGLMGAFITCSYAGTCAENVMRDGVVVGVFEKAEYNDASSLAHVTDKDKRQSFVKCFYTGNLSYEKRDVQVTHTELVSNRNWEPLPIRRDVVGYQIQEVCSNHSAADCSFEEKKANDSGDSCDSTPLLPYNPADHVGQISWEDGRNAIYR